MKVVIVGPRDKEELIYVPLVNDIIDNAKEIYKKLLIITKSCDQGVGKIIRNRCLRAREVAGVMQYKWNNAEFDMIEVSLRHYLMPGPSGEKRELPQSEFQNNFDSLNSSLIKLGDEFHLIVEDPPKGSMIEILALVTSNNLPHSVYGPKDLKNGYKQPVSQVNV